MKIMNEEEIFLTDDGRVTPRQFSVETFLVLKKLIENGVSKQIERKT